MGESVIHTLQAEIDDALQQAKNSEDKSKRAMVDAARLADELRAEQDHVQAESRAKRSLDTQLGELENRLADAEAAAAKGGKSAMAKLEMKIVCLTWLTNCNKRSRLTRPKLRRLKKLQLLTWPSTAKLNKSLKKLKSVANWLELPWDNCKSLFT